ncbi:unnamed protein product [Ranitomeya imitator]|uniref:CCAAT-binding factor domain-containing protein n=1 Tax=Ranitomeya imitator TaxID=111125 RepID=A0ABN9LVD0_9NEOB|nr:unnamed protein product [Ranitomeya imitator]
MESPEGTTSQQQQEPQQLSDKPRRSSQRRSSGSSRAGGAKEARISIPKSSARKDLPASKDPPSTVPLITGREQLALESEVRELQQKNVLVRVPAGEEGYIGGLSTAFQNTVDKPLMPELAMCTLMKVIQLTGKFPLESAVWRDSYRFPRRLLKLAVDRLLQEEKDSSPLISRFQEYLEYDDVRYYTMSVINERVTQVHPNTKEPLPTFFMNNVFGLLSSINMSEESELSNFLIAQKEKVDDWKPAKLKEHQKTFERVWMSFLKHKLSVSLYKKVLLILHESILPHMCKPALMIDFLTVAYDVGGAISLLALNGLFFLIHEHNLEYPDFYKKLYSLLDPSVFHVKYRARFFNLADLFLSSTHLPVYLVAAFVKRLSRLCLTAPPQVLMMIIPLICNLIRRHPACRPLIHRPSAEGLTSDPFVMEEQDPAKSCALESSLWELEPNVIGVEMTKYVRNRSSNIKYGMNRLPIRHQYGKFRFSDRI